jgi:hypothetical protein
MESVRGIRAMRGSSGVGRRRIIRDFPDKVERAVLDVRKIATATLVGTTPTPFEET